jgi:type IV pilus assembly protein PilV
MTTIRRTPHAQRGFMLLEALVALLIFSIGVLGIVGLQASMTKAQTGSKFRADAAFLAQRLIGGMWSDRSGLDNYATGVAAAAAATGACASHTRCSEWFDEVAGQLPGGIAKIEVTSLGTDAAGVVIAAEVTITIQWTPPNEELRRYTTVSAVSANT